jgi:hypothetical protein
MGLGYALLLALVLCLAFTPAESAFKVTAVTEVFSGFSTRPLRLGPTRVRSTQLPGHCTEPTLELPAGTRFEGYPGSLQVIAPASQPLAARCELAVSSPAVPLRRIELVPPQRARDGDEPRVVLHLAGTLTLGGEVDQTSPTGDLAILRSAKVVIETKDLLGPAVSASAERQVDAGYRLTFQQSSGDEAPVEGIVLMRPTSYEFVVRFSGSGVLMTPPGAGRGIGSIAAPGFLDQLKAQAPWGVGAVLLALVLGLLELFRSWASAPREVR